MGCGGGDADEVNVEADGTRGKDGNGDAVPVVASTGGDGVAGDGVKMDTSVGVSAPVSIDGIPLVNGTMVPPSSQLTGGGAEKEGGAVVDWIDDVRWDAIGIGDIVIWGRFVVIVRGVEWFSLDSFDEVGGGGHWVDHAFEGVGAVPTGRMIIFLLLVCAAVDVVVDAANVCFISCSCVTVG